jgi:hypothetical protein
VRVDGAVPPGLPPMSQIKTKPYNFAWSAANKDKFVAHWTELVQKLGM